MLTTITISVFVIIVSIIAVLTILQKSTDLYTQMLAAIILYLCLTLGSTSIVFYMIYK